MKRKLPAIILLALLVSACSKLTQANYDKVETGMAFDEVSAILGTPDSCSETLGVKKCTWGDEQKHVNINFVADKVMLSNAKNIH
ncbi:MAG: hypothetical protein GC139_07075 [Sideroxydans sp.]|nr:hypothetical protein [Sideroxydans sp.]